MAVEEDKLRVAAFTIAATCFLALAISIRFVRQFLMKPRRKKSCYLTTESKPQYSFKRVLADNSYSPFKHLKLHAADSQSDEEYSNLHPYKGEISKLIKNPNVAFLEVLDGCEKGVLEMGDSYVWVETEAQLRELVEVLSNEKVFAVDTEQHSFRSFLGFTALIQISTIREDYLVDTIILHDVMGLLRPLFADPGICKIVMTYYGGREISEEDLERALLVGMTPHERRKFEKKRGFAFKHLTGGIYLNDGRENNIGSKGTPSTQTALKGESMDTNMTLMNQEQDVDTSMIEEREGSTQPSSLNDGGNIAESTTDTDDVASDLKIVEDDDISGSGNGTLPNETTCSMHVRDVSLKHESKLSLLGHGPHGKQVVAHLLKEYGEDGIREFCQRWRQVFVEALHPRFLPAGWDVMHSGKRDFGEYSVYNPTKKSSGGVAAG
ncbi:UNVERIFIED_CONTAM: protein RRP6-like 3 [Sesamum calycinum]|uniref:Protein RRP6-like 3 n=1 Tax=Sesamum calycinum TaxID=2727403 RepID=A0AAW2Q432_9LAMI